MLRNFEPMPAPRARVVTVVAGVCLLGFVILSGIGLLEYALDSRDVPPALLAPLAVLFPAIAAYLWFAPRALRYAAGEGALHVRTLLRRRRFPLAGRVAVRRGVAPTLRLFGTSMPGYHEGLFRWDGASLRIYATRLDEGVLLEGAPRVFVSPADLEAFLDALRREGAVVQGDWSSASP